jgi:hypothetical protein
MQSVKQRSQSAFAFENFNSICMFAFIDFLLQKIIW